MGNPVHAVYLFAICLTLALLEVQIEGAHGWAARLPTWRWDAPWLLRLTGRPITGYHLYLNLLLLLLLHVPFWGRAPHSQQSWSWAAEATVCSTYSLMTVVWDFLWFVVNPHFRLRRFRPEHVWWFRAWFLGVPRIYFEGLALSLVVYMSLGPANSFLAAAFEWGVSFLILAGLAGAVVLVTIIKNAGPAPGSPVKAA